jgi:hypothetical protein
MRLDIQIQVRPPFERKSLFCLSERLTWLNPTLSIRFGHGEWACQTLRATSVKVDM